MGDIFVAIVAKAAQAIDANNVMTNKADEAFDAVEESARTSPIKKRQLGAGLAWLRLFW
jgi:hypothetical protein